MTEDVKQVYLHPLTTEARLFLKSLTEVTKRSDYHHIDLNLNETLLAIVRRIETFLESRPQPIVATEQTRLIEAKQVDCLQYKYDCLFCCRQLGGSLVDATNHIASDHLELTTPDPKMKKSGRNPSALSALPKPARALFKYNFDTFFNRALAIAENLMDLPSYDLLDTELEELIRRRFPRKSVKIYRFGSRIAGTATLASDLDLYVDIGNNFNKFHYRPTHDQMELFYDVDRLMSAHSTQWRGLMSIDSARVPIIKVRHNGTNIQCDIGFTNSLCVCNTLLMKYFFALQPMARRLCIFLKHWKDCCKLSSHFSAYSLSLMVVFFLQVNGYLPSVKVLQAKLIGNTSAYVGPWISQFTQDTHESLDLKNIPLSTVEFARLLKLFFKFYAAFNFKQHAACPYLGRIIAISEIGAHMPRRYKDFINNNPTAALKGGQYMVLQDPLELTHNVTKAISHSTCQELANYYKLCENVL